MEPGRRGKPSRRFVHRVCQFLGIIWDEAEELQHLADLSHPRVVVDTAGLSVKATLFANLLAGRIAGMDEETFDRLLREIENGHKGRSSGNDEHRQRPTMTSTSAAAVIVEPELREIYPSWSGKDRKSVVWGKSVSGRVELVGRRVI